MVSWKSRINPHLILTISVERFIIKITVFHIIVFWKLSHILVFRQGMAFLYEKNGIKRKERENESTKPTQMHEQEDGSWIIPQADSSLTDQGGAK